MEEELAKRRRSQSKTSASKKRAQPDSQEAIPSNPPTAQKKKTAKRDSGGNGNNGKDKDTEGKDMESVPDSIANIGSVINDSQSVDKADVIQISLPVALKNRMIKDFENIAKDKKLIKIPCKNPVSTIFQEFLTHKPHQNAKLKLLKELVNGLTSYFNRIVFTMLLYKFEVDMVCLHLLYDGFCFDC